MNRAQLGEAFDRKADSQCAPRATGGDEVRESLRPYAFQLRGGEESCRQQRVVQFVGVPGIRTFFFPHSRDGVRVERAKIAGRRWIGGPA